MRVSALKALDAYIASVSDGPRFLYVHSGEEFTWRELFPDVDFGEDEMWDRIAPNGFYIRGLEHFIKTNCLPYVFYNEYNQFLFYYVF